MATDFERKLDELKDYYNNHRVHGSLDGRMPNQISAGT